MKRTIEDCIWLRKVLKKIYAGCYIPPPCKFKLIFGTKTEIEVFKHQRFLNKFFQAVVMHPELKNSWHLEVFLQETDLEKFRKVQKDSKKILKAQMLDEIQTASGFIDCEKKVNRVEHGFITSYINAAQPLFRKIKNLTKILEETLKETSKALGKIGRKVKKLQKVLEIVPNNMINQQFFQNFAENLEAWNRNTMENMKIIKDEINGYFKYSSSELLPFRSLIKKFEFYNNAQEKAEKAFKMQLSMTFTYKAQEDWDLSPTTLQSKLPNKEYTLSKMLHTEKQKLLNLKHISHYYNYQLKAQFEWFLRFNETRNFLYFSRLCKLEEANLKRFKESQNNFLQVCDRLKEGILV